MNHKLIPVVCLAIALLAGCNADPGSRREIALLRAELVDLENEYYSLKSRCEDAGPDTNGSANCDDSGTVNRGGETCPVERYPGNGSAPASMPPSTLQSPAPGQSPAISPGSVEPVPEEIDLYPPDAPATGNSAAARSGGAAANPPAEILFVDDQTRAHDHNGDGSPDGVEAGFVLLDSAGQAVTGPARLVFSLMDDALPSGQQRLGLWEHNAIPASSATPADASGTQRVFLPWQGSPPEHDELWLFVRVMGGSATSEASTPLRLNALAPPSSENASGGSSRSPRTAGNGPEIEIDVDGLAETDQKAGGRRPRWRATR